MKLIKKFSDKKWVLMAMSLVMLVIVSLVVANIINRLRNTTPAAVISSDVVTLANTDRAANSLLPLKVSPILVEAATLKAQDMATKSYFAHVGPDGLDTRHWFTAVGYNFRYAGENLAVNFNESSDVETAWLNSISHRENILNDKFTEIGVATATGTYKGVTATFVVEMFGMPMPTSTLVSADR